MNINEYKNECYVENMNKIETIEPQINEFKFRYTKEEIKKILKRNGLSYSEFKKRVEKIKDINKRNILITMIIENLINNEKREKIFIKDIDYIELDKGKESYKKLIIYLRNKKKIEICNNNKIVNIIERLEKMYGLTYEELISKKIITLANKNYSNYVKKCYIQITSIAVAVIIAITGNCHINKYLNVDESNNTLISQECIFDVDELVELVEFLQYEEEVNYGK